MTSACNVLLFSEINRWFFCKEQGDFISIMNLYLLLKNESAHSPTLHLCPCVCECVGLVFALRVGKLSLKGYARVDCIYSQVILWLLDNVYVSLNAMDHVMIEIGRDFSILHSDRWLWLTASGYLQMILMWKYWGMWKYNAGCVLTSQDKE